MFASSSKTNFAFASLEIQSDSISIQSKGRVETKALMDIMMDRKGNHLFESGRNG